MPNVGRRVLGADIALPNFWQDVRDDREIAVGMQHGQTVMNSGGAHQQVDGTRAAVLSLLGELYQQEGRWTG